MLVFGGPYGNRQALDALFAEAKSLGIPAGNMLCTGDLAAYAADPQYVVDRMREAAIPVVMGNVEESLGTFAADCGCGFAKGSDCDTLSAEWFRFAAAAVDDESKAWMRTLPRRIGFVAGGKRCVAIHGGVDRINQFLFPTTDGRELSGQCADADADMMIGGHSGLPFTREIANGIWHNPGVIGLPANDGTPRVWYGLIRPASAGLTLEHRALSYDHTAAAAGIRSSGLPPEYATALETGIWPSDDIMPEADRRRRGQPIAPWSFDWRSTHPPLQAAE
jgi:predicted phosphodiesterase